MRCFGGLVSSRRYHPDQKNEIYNFRVVLVEILDHLWSWVTFWTTSRSLGDPAVVEILDHLHSPRPQPSSSFSATT